MSLQAIAAVASMPTPMPGEENRASRNFQFMKLPSSGDIIVSFQGVANPSEIEATLVHHLRFENDKIICSLGDGVAFDASWVETGANYYIAAPEYASVNFLVIFKGELDTGD